MQFPESWLRAFCNPPLSTEQLADVLTMGGLEVEQTRPVAPAFSHVVVGRIVSAKQHPNADRLRVCAVDIGTDAPLAIVCGAPNARVGLKAPCALVGAILPPAKDGGEPFAISVGELRGVASHGMLCSARELGISDEQGGLLELATDAPVGADLREWLALDDMLFTLKLTPNLAHALSIYGIARELSALTGATLEEPTFPPAPIAIDDQLPVTLTAADLCGRFSGRIVRNVNPQATTPAWMVERLARCGQRSVSALVDISNYVMFELGRPSHIFDLDKIDGGLDVRWGKPGEQLELLNGDIVTVDEKVGVIADQSRVESLAGVMGGEATAVGDETRNIYLEAAFWWPAAIAGRARRYNFSTDASHRFERGVDPTTTVPHLERITRLVLDICGTPETTCGPVDDQITKLPELRPVMLRIARAAKVLGMPITQAQCTQGLRRLGLTVIEGDGTLTVVPPGHRFDLRIEEDLIEEVARLIGYDALPTTPPIAPIRPRLPTESQRSPFALRRTLAGLGYFETINFSFVDAAWEHELAGNPDPVKVLNPIASHMSVMRSSLLASLLQVLKFNVDRKAPQVRVFELGRVFLRNPQRVGSDQHVAGFDQPMRVAGLAWGPVEPLQWTAKPRQVDFFDVKGEVEALLAPRIATFEPATHPALHPGRCASVRVGDAVIGIVGELHPKWRQQYELTHAPVLFELDLQAVLQSPVPQFEPVARRQAVERDIAVIVPEHTTHQAVMHTINESEARILPVSAQLFDVYRSQGDATASTPGAGEKSIAVRLTFLSADDEQALDDARIDEAVRALVEALQSQVKARLRH
ncbi:MAG: phenylalanine--tRNA ligase subunit beta [Burkholderiaceae bacterium]